MARTLEQILNNEKSEVVLAAKKEAADILLNIHLAELRELMQLTQSDLAKQLGIKQPSVSEMEKPGKDLRLSSLKRYIEASGGKVYLDIELSDGSHHHMPL